MAPLLLLLALVGSSAATVKLQEMFSWNILDWEYPSEQAKLKAINDGELIPENALPVGVERWGNKLFVSVPRWRPGIPATLNYIPLDAPYQPSPKLLPYPSWQANELGNCASGLTTVYRIKADSCNRLWVLDVGTYGYDPNVTNVCPYSINIYDLNTDRRIRRYVFRPEDIVADTFIANIALDEGKTCDDAFAYFSDELGYGLIVYSFEQNKSWRFNHDYFRPDPLRGDYNIAGMNFQWGAEGIFGIATSSFGVDGFRTLYFSPLTSHTEFAVSTRVLRNESAVTTSYKEFKVVGERGANGHTTSHVMSASGVELFTMIDQNAVGCWYSGLPHRPQNVAVVDKDDVGLIFPCDVKIVNEKEVWVLSDRMSIFLESPFGLDYSDVNFRIYTAPLDSLLAGTVCEPPSFANAISLPDAPVSPKALPPALTYYDSRFGPTPSSLGPPVFPQSNYPQGNFPQSNFPQSNFPQGSFPQSNLPQRNLPQSGLPQPQPLGRVPQIQIPQRQPIGQIQFGQSPPFGQSPRIVQIPQFGQVSQLGPYSQVPQVQIPQVTTLTPQVPKAVPQNPQIMDVTPKPPANLIFKGVLPSRQSLSPNRNNFFWTNNKYEVYE